MTKGPKIGDEVIYRLADGDEVPARIVDLPLQGYANIDIQLGPDQFRRYDYVRISKLEWPDGKDGDQAQGIDAA